MKQDDVVQIITGCANCGDVTAKVLDIVHDRAFVEVIGDLPHKVSERRLWVDTKRLRIVNE